MAIALLWLSAAGPATAQRDASSDAIPPMDGASIEGTVVTEDDVVIDELGNTRLDLAPSGLAAEPLPPEIEERLDALSRAREEMAAAVISDPPSPIPPLDDPDAPPRMDARSGDPDRLRRAEADARLHPPPPPYEPEIPVETPSETLAAPASAD